MQIAILFFFLFPGKRDTSWPAPFFFPFLFFGLLPEQGLNLFLQDNIERAGWTHFTWPDLWRGLLARAASFQQGNSSLAHPPAPCWALSNPVLTGSQGGPGKTAVGPISSLSQTLQDPHLRYFPPSCSMFPTTSLLFLKHTGHAPASWHCPCLFVHARTLFPQKSISFVLLHPLSLYSMRPSLTVLF